METKEELVAEPQGKKDVTTELIKMIIKLQREIEEIKTNQGTLKTPDPIVHKPDESEAYRAMTRVAKPVIISSQVSIRDALAVVPKFDGQNMTVLKFAKYCKIARDMAPPELEAEISTALITKLPGHVLMAVEDRHIITIESLIDRLKLIFNPAKTANQYRGELSDTFLKPKEDLLDYVSRIKDLRTAILDEETKDPRFIVSEYSLDRLDSEVLTAFFNGLPSELSLRLEVRGYKDLDEAIEKVIAINKQLEAEKSHRRMALEQERSKPIS